MYIYAMLMLIYIFLCIKNGFVCFLFNIFFLFHYFYLISLIICCSMPRWLDGLAMLLCCSSMLDIFSVS